MKYILGALMLASSLSYAAPSAIDALHSRGQYSAQDGYNDTNFYSNGEFEFLCRWCPNHPNAVVFDVGANVGAWSKMVGRLAPKASIYAFEPDPNTFSQLSGVTSVPMQVFNLGLHSEEGVLPLYLWGSEDNPDASQLNGLHYRSVLPLILNKQCTSVDVRLTTLDRFCQEHQIDHIDLLKIDTEGNEWNVLVGAQEMLKSGKIDCIQFEYGGCYIDSESTLFDVYQLLTSCGYRISRLLPHAKRYFVDEWDSSLENYQYSNYIAEKN